MLNNKVLKKLQSGVTMIEYALIAGLISVIAVLALTSIGTLVKAKLVAICIALGGTCT